MGMQLVETLKDLRQLAEDQEDQALAVKISAAIACQTQDPQDVMRVIGLAKSYLGHKSVIAESIAVVVRVLARAGRFDEARIIAMTQMEGLDRYWAAETFISIAEFTKENNDITDARMAIAQIHSEELRKEATADLEIVLEKEDEDSPMEFPEEALLDLAQMLATLSQNQRTTLNSGYLHAVIDQIIDRVFAAVLY